MNDEIQIPNNEISSWNDKIEKVAREIGEASKGYKVLHINEAQKAVKNHSRLMVAGIVVGPLTGVLSGIEAALRPPKEDPIIPVIVILLGFLSGIIVATIKFAKYDEVSNANKSAAASYTSLESNVRRQLGLYRKDRVEAIKYMEWLETKYQELFMSAPLLPIGSYKQDKDNTISVPNKYGSNVTIDESYRNRKSYEITNTTEIEINDRNDITEIEISDSSSEETKISPKEKTKVKRKVKRTQTMSKIPQLNQFSDKMLEYEMKRMMGI
jgi:hypothetical protein